MTHYAIPMPPRGIRPLLCRSSFLNPDVLLQMPLFITIIVMCQGVVAKKIMIICRHVRQDSLLLMTSDIIDHVSCKRLDKGDYVCPGG